MLDKQVALPCQADFSLSSSILCLILTYYAFFGLIHLIYASTEVYLHFFKYVLSS